MDDNFRYKDVKKEKEFEQKYYLELYDRIY